MDGLHFVRTINNAIEQLEGVRQTLLALADELKKSSGPYIPPVADVLRQRQEEIEKRDGRQS